MRRLLLILALVVGGVSVALAQRTISGSIQDVTGQPLIGSSILIQGTTTGTVTDLDGNFTLTVPAGAENLIVSYTGFTTKTVPLTAASTYPIVLDEGVKLSDVVVTALGISRSEKSLGYAVAEVDGGDLTKANETSLVSALSGRVAGVQINNSNSGLGGSSSILLRGATSITGSNQPLFVVDGTPISNNSHNGADASVAAGGRDYGNTVNDINPNDIASVSILKGGAAAALYGSRASNGVILITTKSGKSRKGVGITVNSGLTFQQVAVLPDYQNTYGGGYSLEFQTFEFDPAIHPAEWSSFDGQQMPEYYADESWGPALEGQNVRHWDSWYAGENFGELRPWRANPDNVRDFYDTGVQWNNNVSITGGGDNSTFRLSYTNNANKGVFPESRMNRNTVSINAEQKLGSKLTAGVNGSYVNTRGEGRPAIGYGGFGNAVNVQTNFNQWFQRQLDMDRLQNYKSPDGTPRTWNLNSPTNTTALYWESPYWVVNEDRGSDNRDRVFGNLNLKYEITPELSITGFARTDQYTFQVQDRLASLSTANLAYYETLNVVNRENNFEALVDYNTNVSDFSISTQLGANLRQNEYSSDRDKTSGGLTVPNLYTITASADRPEQSRFRSQKEVQSVYGRVGLGWKAMLYVDVTARNDWSSTLEDGFNSYFYPSVSTSFVFSELLGNSDIVSFGKIRAGYAVVGNDTDPYNTRNAFVDANSFGTSPAFAVDNTQAKFDLVSEEIATYEIGLDMRFLNDRAGFDVTYYEIESSDLIIPIGVSGTSGFSNVFTNAGLLTNKGIEARVYATPIQTPNFTWTTELNFARNRNEVVELSEGLTRLPLGSYGTQFVAEVGQPYGTLIGIGYTRNDDGSIFINENGFPVQQNNIDMGSAYPDFTGGFVNTFQVFGFNIGSVFDFRKGGTLYSVSNRWGTYSGQFSNTVGLNANGVDIRQPVADGGGILVEGNFADGTPNNVYVDAQTHFGRLRNFREAFTYDASFIKLREISIGRELPTAWFANNFIANARLSLVGRNLAILHKNTPNIDPESAVTNGNIQGFENGQNPSVRSFGLNLNVGF